MKKHSSRNFKSIRDYLKRTGQTEAELGGLAGISQSHVNKLKNGTRRPTPEVAARLEAITGIPLRILLFKTDRKGGGRLRSANSASLSGKRRSEHKEPQQTDCMENIS